MNYEDQKGIDGKKSLKTEIHKGVNRATKYFESLVKCVPTFAGMELVEETRKCFTFTGNNFYNLSIFKKLSNGIRQVKVVPFFDPVMSAWIFFIDSKNQVNLILRAGLDNGYDFEPSSMEDFEKFDAGYKEVVKIVLELKDRRCTEVDSPGQEVAV